MGEVQVHDADASSERRCSRDQKQPCTDSHDPEGSPRCAHRPARDVRGWWLPPRQPSRAVPSPRWRGGSPSGRRSTGCSGDRGAAARVARPCRRPPATYGRVLVPPGRRQGDVPSTR